MCLAAWFFVIHVVSARVILWHVESFLGMQCRYSWPADQVSRWYVWAVVRRPHIRCADFESGPQIRSFICGRPLCTCFLKPRFWFLEWGAISGARFEPPFCIWACVTSGLLRLLTGHAKLSAFVPWRHPMSVPCSSTSTCGCRLAPKTGRHRMSLAFYQMPLRLLTGYVLNMGIVTVTFTHKNLDYGLTDKCSLLFLHR